MATGSNSDIGGTWHHDIRAHYRTTEHGAHIVVVPTRCPSRIHALTTDGYRCTSVAKHAPSSPDRTTVGHS